MYDLRIYFLIFIIYSFLGWIVEIIDMIFETKRLVNRGFLIGPYCPIYGVGALLMISVLSNYKDDIHIVFGMGLLMCGVLEYLTSYIMEKVFNARWWDYSNYKFNLNGRICLLNLVFFGVGGILVVCYLNPFILSVLNKIPDISLTIISIILLIIFVIDFCVSFKIIFEFKNITSNIKKDSTEEIKKRVKNIIEKKSILYRRLVESFPKFQLKLKKYNERLKRIAK